MEEADTERTGRSKTDSLHAGTRPSKRRRWRRYLVAIVPVIVILPWPADNSHFLGSDYQTTTLARLRAKTTHTAQARTIRLGTAQVDITPPNGHPLAGYAIRTPKSCADIHSPCYARALTLDYGTQQITILTADLLTIHQNVAQEILVKADLKAEDVYFTASHTHSGPGGYVDRFVEELCLGKYNAAYFDNLTTKLADVVKQSRRKLAETEIGVLTIQADDMLKNHIDESLPAYGKLSALVFSEPAGDAAAGRTLAVLVSFSAHPTILTEHQHLLSSSYPGALADELKRLTGARMVLFAAGAVGGTNPSFRHARPEDRYERSVAYGKILANRLKERWAEVQYSRRPAMSNVRLRVDLPAFRIGFGSRLRLNPLCTSWLADRQTHLHVVRIGKTVLAGFPGDYGCDLALALDERFSGSGLELIPTSFNGDWRGYLVSSDLFFKYLRYETRLMNFFGPFAGEYLNDLAKRMIEHTTN